MEVSIRPNRVLERGMGVRVHTRTALQEHVREVSIAYTASKHQARVQGNVHCRGDLGLGRVSHEAKGAQRQPLMSRGSALQLLEPFFVI